MKLEYRAFDKAGREVCAVMEAACAAEATEKLSRQELFVADISPVGERAAAPLRSFRLPRGRIRALRDLAMFTRQLYSLVRAGTPLAQGLGALEKQARDERWAAVIRDVRASLERGATLAEAMRAHPDCFDKVYTSMVAAGESSGKLTVLLDRLATLTRKRVHVLGVIRGAMAYPVLLSIVAASVMSALLLFVVPRFGELFRGIGAPLPPTTAFLISLGEGLRQYWWAAGGALTAGTAALVFFVKSPAGKRTMDSFLLRVPRVGRMIKSFATARIARLLGLLMDSHLPIQDILRMVGAATGNAQYAALLAKAQENVAHGEPIHTAFRETDLISPSVYEAIRSGEQSGQVGPLLLELADFLDDENETSLKALTSIIEPLLLVIMGLVVGLVAVSIFLPLFDVTSMVNGGGR
ncbi:MAG: type II secretion system F family protein [Phycisphaerae bacterium]